VWNFKDKLKGLKINYELKKMREELNQEMEKKFFKKLIVPEFHKLH